MGRHRRQAPRRQRQCLAAAPRAIVMQAAPIRQKAAGQLRRQILQFDQPLAIGG